MPDTHREAGTAGTNSEAQRVPHRQRIGHRSPIRIRADETRSSEYFRNQDLCSLGAGAEIAGVRFSLPHIAQANGCGVLKRLAADLQSAIMAVMRCLFHLLL